MKIIDISILNERKFPTRQELVQRNRIKDRAQLIMNAGRGLTVPADRVWGKPSNGDSGNEWINGLQRDDLNDVNNHGLFVLGYGDPRSPYGAGPTRDPRRATYAARLMVRFEDIPIFSKGFFRTAESKHVDGLNAWAEEYMRKDNPNAFRGLQYDSRDQDASFYFYVGNNYFGGQLINLTRDKNGLASTVSGDLVFIINDGFFSGQDFIDDFEFRNSSPIYGKLEHIFSEGNEIYKRIGLELQERLDNQRSLVEGLVEIIGKKTDYAGLITIDNT